ncbi:MAG: hypothetical protein Q8M17_14295 [Actinomycetota bacterium]|nr:hypothetical protein [Actinomycetota bacterium]
MSAAARKHAPAAVDAAADATLAPTPGPGIDAVSNEYATRGAWGHRSSRPHLRIASPLRAERASRGVFALVVTGLLVVGMVVILVINTSLAQGAFTISELQSQQAALSQEEQALSEAVAAAGAPQLLEQRARELGMVPTGAPVFLSLPRGKVVGKPKAAPGGTSAIPMLDTPADATVTEAVDNASVGTDLPVAPGSDYDPAAVDAAAAQAAAANAAPPTRAGAADPAMTAIVESARGIVQGSASSESSLWSDSTVIDVTSQVSSEDAGLLAVPVR